MEEQIILVDKKDKQIGTIGKTEAHEKGLLHRAFSIFVTNDRGEMMIQKRAAKKYHCGGLWTNTCCSHPRNGENISVAVHRRLKEEMGFDCPLTELFVFQYRVVFDNGLTENEINHVFVGKYNGPVVLNPEEADDWKWIATDDVKFDVVKNPNNFTYWFRIALQKAEENNFNL